MAFNRERMRPFIPVAAGLASGLAACLVLLVSTGDRVPRAERAAAAACAAVLLGAFVLPAISTAFSTEGEGGLALDVRRWARVAGGASGGTALGVLAFVVLTARPVLLATVASLVVVGACTFSFGALARACGKALGSRTAGGLASGAALAWLVAAPFWSRGLLSSSAGAWIGGPLVGASPFLAAALPWTTASATWTFDPRVSEVLYRVWVGTDFPLRYPSWVSCAVGHVIAGCALVAAAEPPRNIREWWRARGSRAPSKEVP